MTQLNLPFDIPGYRILRCLGLGGMATVYLATQESLGRPVAVKVLASERAPSDELVRRFEHEARTIARLDHPHIVSIYDVGRTSNGQIYYTMPYLPNGDLSGRNLREAPQRVLEIMRALVEALGCAHDQGIVHRDVKPENVLFDKLDRPLLADFGIALSGAHQLRITREGATIGSSGYMSPEQARGLPLDGRADFYSLGVMCYELLTGELPFQGADSLAVALAHIEKPVPRLPVTRRLWQPLIDKALAKQPDARFQSAEELLAALDIIDKRLQVPTQNGIAKWWLDLVTRFCAIPRRVRAVGLGLLIIAALVGLLALLPQVPSPTAMPNAGLGVGDAAPAAADPASAQASPAATVATGAGTDPAAAIVAPVAAAPDATAVVVDPAAAVAAAPAEDSPEAKAAARDLRLKQAADLVTRGKLLAPENGNAADIYLDILHDEPRQRDALRGLGRIFTALATRAVKALDAGDAAAAVEPVDQGLALAERAKLSASPTFAAFVAPIKRVVDDRRTHRHDPFDTAALRDLAPLLPSLARLDPELAKGVQADIDRPAALLSGGGSFRDPEGPALVVVPSALAATGNVERAFAVATSDVTRGAWERFVESTHRAAAPCKESQRLFARSDGLGWRSPGFAQGDDHPVVCVSWDDATAYVAWLSQRTGARYRLPTQREWMLLAQPAGAGTACGAANIGRRFGKAASCDDGYAQTAPVGHFATTPPGLYDIAGNVSVWLGDCAKPGRDGAACRERMFRGLSWRDDGNESNLTRSDTSSADIGYASVGLRVVRELPIVAAH